MIKPVKIYYLLVWLLIAGQYEVGGQDVPKIRIDPSKAYGGKVSEYFESVEYIPLETTKESLFGDINRLIVTDSSYVLNDFDTFSILFFSSNGQFIRKVQNTINMIHDKVENTISVFRFPNKQDLTKFIKINYTLTGKELSTTEVDLNNDDKSSTDFAKVSIKRSFSISFNACGYDFRTGKYLDPSCFLSVYKSGQPYKDLLPISEKYKFAICNLKGMLTIPRFIENESFYISTPFDHNIYKVSTDTAILLYQLVFPKKRTFSEEILMLKDQDLIDSIQKKVMDRNQLLIVDVGNIFFLGTRMFFKINTPAYPLRSNVSQNEYQYNYVYDTATKKISTIDRVTPDSLSVFLPIMGERAKEKGLTPHDGHVYSNISSLTMFAAHNATKHRNPQYPPVLQKYFKEENRKSNPVIVRMKLKE